MRPEQIFDELAHAPLANRAVEPVIHKLIKRNGHFFMHDYSLNVVRITYFTATCFECAVHELVCGAPSPRSHMSAYPVSESVLGDFARCDTQHGHVPGG